MATSAAALALYMGVYDGMAETVRNLQMVLGVHFGKSLISDPSRDVAGSTISCCRVRFILFLSLNETHHQVQKSKLSQFNSLLSLDFRHSLEHARPFREQRLVITPALFSVSGNVVEHDLPC